MAAEKAVELINAQLYYCEKNEILLEDDRKVTLFYEDVKDIYQCFFDYEQRLLNLQKILSREIAITNKNYGRQSNGVMLEDALIDAINIIKNNNHTTINERR